MARLAATATYLGYRTAAAVACALPERLGPPVAAATGKGLARAMKGRRHMLARHLRRVHGPELTEAELAGAVAAAFESYAQYWFQAFRMAKETPESLLDLMEIDGRPLIDEALAGGKGLIVVTPHLGNWDMGGAWFAAAGYRPVTVVEPIEPPELFEWFCAARRRFGLEVAPLGEAGPVLLRTLREGRMVGLICDRDIARDGVGVDFFGERTTLPAGPATLALRTGAPIMAGVAYIRPGQRNLCVFRKPIDTSRQGSLKEDVARITQAIADELEELIRPAPEQWHLLQPNWPSDFEAIRTARGDAA